MSSKSKKQIGRWSVENDTKPVLVAETSYCDAPRIAYSRLIKNGETQKDQRVFLLGGTSGPRHSQVSQSVFEVISPEMAHK